MALSDDPYDATELVAFINEVWTPMAQEQYFAKAVASNFFVDLSEFATGGGDIFHVPDYFTGTFSVQSQPTQATVVTNDAPPTTDTTLSINTHKYISTLLGYKDQQQLKRDTYNLSALNNRKAGGTLLHDLEDALFAAHSSVTTNAIGDTATVLTESEIRRAIEKLATLNVPLDECAFFFHPYTYYVQILNIARYYDASQAGWAVNTPVQNGNFGPADRSRGLHGQLLGIPVFVSSRVVNTLNSVRNLLSHKESK